MNNKSGSALSKGCASWFFLFHFGIFHLVYFVFLIIDFPLYEIQRMVLLLGIATFFLESLMSFMRHKRNQDDENMNVGVLFFLPYLRIVPMHLMIILPTFFGWKASLLFLVLKMGADLLSFQLYHFVYSKKKESTSAY
jgi:Family of unknown function (DUF6498)